MLLADHKQPWIRYILFQRSTLKCQVAHLCHLQKPALVGRRSMSSIQEISGRILPSKSITKAQLRINSATTDSACTFLGFCVCIYACMDVYMYVCLYSRLYAGMYE